MSLPLSQDTRSDTKDSGYCSIAKSDMNSDGDTKMTDIPHTSPNLKRKTRAENASRAPSSVASTPAPPAKKAKIAPLCELKNGKISFKQSSLQIENQRETIKAKNAFLDWLDTQKEPISEFPAEHLSLLGKLVHENEKNITPLVKEVKKQIQPLDGETESATEIKLDLLPADVIKKAILSIATKTNHGLGAATEAEEEVLPEGVTEIPPGLRLYRWEVNDRAANFTEALLPKIEERYALRCTIRGTIQAAIDGMTESARTALFAKPTKGKKGKAAEGLNGSAPIVLESDDVAASASKKKGKGKAPLTAEEEAAKAAKDEEKRKKAEEKEAKKAENEAKKAEREAKKAENEAKKAEREAKKAEADEKKAAKEAKKAEKDAEKAAVEEAKAKQTNLMKSFFNVKQEKQASKELSPTSPKSGFQKAFFDFNVLKNTKLFPSFSFPTQSELPLAFNSVSELTLQDSLADFTSKVPPHRTLNYDTNPKPKASVREIVQALIESEALETANVLKYNRLLQDRHKIPIKLLKFAEDVRPGYVGTWTKTSRLVRPRTPFGKDTALMNYDYDSEEDWNEDDGEAEEIDSTQENSEDSDSDRESVDDWLVGDDEMPEMMEGVVIDDDLAGVTPEQFEAQRQQQKRMAAKKAEMAKRRGPLLPVTVGPVWQGNLAECPDARFENFQVAAINHNKFPIDVEHNDKAKPARPTRNLPKSKIEKTNKLTGKKVSKAAKGTQNIADAFKGKVKGKEKAVEGEAMEID